MDVRQMQNVGHFIAARRKRTDMHDLGFFPLEHLEKLLYGQELTVGAGDRDDRHGAAGAIPDIVRLTIVRAEPGLARTFALGGQQDARLPVDDQMVG